jgi:hypothetical protein
VSQTWGAPPAPGMPPPPPPQYRRPGPPWGVIAAIVTGVCLLVAAVVGAALFVYTTTDDADDDERAAQAGLVVAPQDVILALDVERSMATVTVLDMVELVDIPIEDNAEARRRTDAALREFEATVAGSGAYRDGLAAFDGLAALRAEADGTTRGSGELFAATRPIRDRYGEMIAALLDANTRFVDTIDDPGLRQGARLFEVGLRQIELVRQLATEVSDIGGWTMPEWVTRVSSMQSTLTRGQVAVMEQATGAHAAAADRLDAELEAAGTDALVDQVLETGQGEFGAVVQSVGDTLRAWQTFLGEVEARLTRSA